MNTQQLIRNLFNPEAAQRVEAARILGMVDEVEALPAMQKAFKSETDAHVKSTLQWAGKRLQAAHAIGYSTFDAIWHHFSIERELDALRHGKTPDEKYYSGLSGHELDMLYNQGRLENKLNNLTGGINRLIPGGKKTSGYLEPHLADGFKAGKRIMPPEPTQQDVRPHVQRLLRDADANVRRKAAITLADINNPAALPALARAFVADPAPGVGEAAQQSGKRLYWNLLYYEMDHDGTITHELQRRKALLEPAKPVVDTDPAPKINEQQKIEDMLRKGQQKQRRRYD